MPPLKGRPDHDMEELAAWLALHRALGFRARPELFDALADPRTILRTPRGQLAGLGLSDGILEKLAAPDWHLVEKDLSWLDSSRCRVISYLDPRYPESLKRIQGAPPLLFVTGDADLLSMPMLAVVGSRSPTPAWVENAYRFARHLAARGLGIISGMAIGIDGAAHRGALDAEGATVAVMGTGPDRIYPARHHELARRIAERGVLITEFPPGMGPQRRNFPLRNRIISGLSLGTLVVEAARNSGSLITARSALEQSREVFAVPGSIHNPMARGCHALIRQGAKLVECAEDIWEEIGPQLAGMAAPAAGPVVEAEIGGAPVAAEYAALLGHMGWDPISVDELVELSGLTAEAVSSMLLILELEGHVNAMSGGVYARRA